jgi:hypothetical protein
MDKPKLKHLGRGHYQSTYRGVDFQVFEQWHPSGLSQGWFIREGQNAPVRSGNSRSEAVTGFMLKLERSERFREATKEHEIERALDTPAKAPKTKLGAGGIKTRRQQKPV